MYTHTTYTCISYQCSVTFTPYSSNLLRVYKGSDSCSNILLEIRERLAELFQPAIKLFSRLFFFHQQFSHLTFNLFYLQTLTKSDNSMFIHSSCTVILPMTYNITILHTYTGHYFTYTFHVVVSHHLTSHHPLTFEKSDTDYSDQYNDPFSLFFTIKQVHS